MNVYRNIEDVFYVNNTAVTIGSFDGVHNGHKRLIGSLLEIADDYRLRDFLITFDPHPRHVLRKNDDKLKLLNESEEKIALFERMGINNLLIIKFDENLAALSAEDFVREHLVKKIGLKQIIIGYDHNFGKGGEGNFELLEKLGKELNFETKQIDVILKDETIISSTKIRNAIASNMIEYANSMLGYHYFIKGTVVHGQGLATGLGFPTANFGNINPIKQMPSNGVYLVSSKINGKKYYGMANCGLRPTITKDIVPTLEVNFFDFKGDLYGSELTVSFINSVRAEKKFDRVEQLIMQVQKDKQYCYELISYVEKQLKIKGEL